MALLWLMDATIASMSYSIESRWLENRSRSLDLSAGGWFICFSCYAPLNEATGALFPFAPLLADHNPASLLFNSDSLLYTGLILENIILALLVYSDAALGPSIANISLKKLQTRGPFALVRHPVYTLKIIMWWVMSITYRKFWTARYLFGQMMWTLIYVLRAYSEERHLKKFAEYREYMQKVRYRFLPWLF
jgi:protein-S-isoprenylcysteine O-methyltransferase Ste14